MSYTSNIRRLFDLRPGDEFTFRGGNSRLYALVSIDRRKVTLKILSGFNRGQIVYLTDAKNDSVIHYRRF